MRDRNGLAIRRRGNCGLDFGSKGKPDEKPGSQRGMNMVQFGTGTERNASANGQ
jgi:hypothetical protein